MKKIICIISLLLVALMGLSACGNTSCNLYFYVEGELYEVVEASGKYYVPMPEAPTKDGYTFDGWFFDEDVWQKPFKENSLISAPIKDDACVYAKFIKNSQTPQNPSNPSTPTNPQGPTNPEGPSNPQNPSNPSNPNESHTHNYTPVVTPPTCKEQGYTTYTCSCGDSYKGDFTENGSHSYDKNNECTVCHDIPQSAGLSFQWNAETQGYAVSQGTATDKNIFIPYKYEDKPVTVIAKKGFYESKLESVYIPKSVKVIDSNAFNRCEKLTSVVVPEGVTELCGGAFYYCRQLESITLPDSLITIGEEVFSWCTRLKSLVIPKSTVNLGSSLSARYAFKEYVSFESISVASGNPKYHSTGNNIIETQTQTLVYGIQGCTIPSDGSVTTIGLYAFESSRNLGKVTIPSAVRTLKTNAFRSAGITELIIEEGVREIGFQAFRGCGITGTVTIPNSVEKLDSWAFGDCTKIEKVVIGSGLSKIGGNAFYGCKQLKEITIGENVKEIGSYAFYNCTSLKNAYFICKTSWSIYEDSYYTKKKDSASVNDSANAAKSLAYEPWERCLYYWKRNG